MAELDDQNIAESNDPSVLDNAVDYWGDDTNVEATQQAEAPVETPQDTGLDAFEHEVANQQVNQETPENADSEQQRYQYWQSRYDQKASEFDAMSQKISEYEKIAPIAEYIQENPAVLKNVARSLSGDNPSVPSQEKSQELLKKPQRPTKPTNYDATEAYMDQDSASFKYRAELDNYRDEMIDYQEKVEEQRIQALRHQEAQIQQRQEEYQQAQAVNGMRNRLINEFGYADDKAEEFLSHYSSPESITLDNLVQLDRLRNSPSQQEVAMKQKVQAMQNQKQRMQVPTPTAIQSGNAEPNFSDDDLFNLGLMANKR
tara:strand:+ start:22701 stop:23645 length:945 start_codon:yes stop_codon:yes gene_type:complete